MREVKKTLTSIYHYDILSLEVIEMSVTMNKELLIRMPSSLYREMVKLSRKRFMSISSFVRELILDQVESSLSAQEEKIVAQGEKQYLRGKGVNWRKIKRG
jgi:hypothetical protein